MYLGERLGVEVKDCQSATQNLQRKVFSIPGAASRVFIEEPGLAKKREMNAYQLEKGRTRVELSSRWFVNSPCKQDNISLLVVTWSMSMKLI